LLTDVWNTARNFWPRFHDPIRDWDAWHYQCLELPSRPAGRQSCAIDIPVVSASRAPCGSEAAGAGGDKNVSAESID
jgi:hypothetical protein